MEPVPTPLQPSGLPPSEVHRRAVWGAGYLAVGSAITTVVGFARSVILARMLMPEVYGVVTFALFFSSLIGSLTQFGFRQAFIHSSQEDEARIAGTMLVVDVSLAVIRLGLVLALLPLFSRLFPEYELLPTVLVVFFAAYIVGAANGTPLAILERRLAYRRIALLNVVVSITITASTVMIARLGFGVWALVAETVLTRVVMFAGLYFIRPPWRFRGEIDLGFVRRFARFSIAVSATGLLGFLLDRLDDFWTGAYLGKTPLGLYSKAYEFARYPRRVLADPIVSVAFPSFSHLKQDGLALSQVFVRALAVLVRLGFLISVSMYLVAPELIEFLIGSAWLPMVGTFRWMVVYALVDPLLSVLGMLFVAVGKPGITSQARLIQLCVFVPAIVLLGRQFGIEGVAVAADVMVVGGFVYMVSRARQYVRFSLRQLLLAPTIAVLISVSLTTALDHFMLLDGSLFGRLVAKLSLILGSALTTLWFLERSTYSKYVPYVSQAWAALVERMGRVGNRGRHEGPGSVGP